MALKLHDQALLALLRAYGSSPRCLRAHPRPNLPRVRPASSLNKPSRRRRTTPNTADAPDVAVLGGGLTGLVTAYYIRKWMPAARVTIYEGSGRLGGWIDTQAIEAEDSSGKRGKVLFERGARSVAPPRGQAKFDDLVLYELIEDLKLHDALFGLSKDAPMHRYIYYPDHLVSLAAPTRDLTRPLETAISHLALVRKVMTEPLFDGLFPSMFQWLGQERSTKRPGRNGGYPDEDMSIGDYFAGEFGRSDLVDNVLSAIVHGVYGGDIYNLSAASSIFGYSYAQQSWHGIQPKAVPGTLRDLWFCRHMMSKSASYRAIARMGRQNGLIWSVKGGFSVVTDALAKKLSNDPNVTFHTTSPVTEIRLANKTPNIPAKVEIKTSGVTDDGPARYDKVISTLFSKTLHELTGGALPSLRNEEAVSMQVVNLFYPTPNLHHPHSGLGYLIPAGIPAEQNPEGALGVLFDSDREAMEHLAAPRSPPPNNNSAPPPTARPPHMPGTKLTVMLGGHLWSHLPRPAWPNAHSAAEMARAVVGRHLGIPATEPVFASAKLCWHAIPQPRVGHRARMAAAHAELRAAFAGRLAVAGGSFSGPGVLGSLRAGRDVAMALAGRSYADEGEAGDMDHVGETGLAGFANAERLPDRLVGLPGEWVTFRNGNEEAWKNVYVAKAEEKD